MRFLCISVCLWALIGCTRDAAPPAEEAAEPTATAEAEPSAEAEPAPSPEPEAAPETQAAPEPAPSVPVEPDPNAPKNVAAPPKDARRTESGVAWKRLAKGKGKQRARGIDTVSIVYTGWLPSGRKFDSSEKYGESVPARADHLIPGLSEMVRAMAVGEKRRVWVPASLAYGEIGSSESKNPSQPLGDLVFDLEVAAIEEAPPAPPAPKDVGAIPPDATKSSSGLAWRVLEDGSGSEKPVITSVVEMNYTMWTATGEVVDSTAFRQGGVDTLGIQRLLPGWTEGMMLMVPGERRIFWIPQSLAYNGAPNRPEGMIVVDVKLHGIRADIHQVR